MRIAIAFAESLAAPETAWSLRDAGHEVVALARPGTKPAIRRCREVEIVRVDAPEHDADRAIDAVADALAESHADWLLPLDDEAIWVAEHLAGRVAARIVGPTGAAAELALDKRRQLALAQAAGFRVPRTETYSSPEALELQAASVTLPAVVRATRAVISVGEALVHPRARIVGDRAELGEALSSFPEDAELIVQPWLRGTSEGMFGLADRGRLLAPSAHERVRMANPHGSHSSACRSRPVDPEVERATARMLLGAHWHGLFMIELLRDRAGVAWFVELNGRPWGSTALSRRLGFEYPAWAAAQALDPAFAPVTPAPEPPVLCRHLGSELVHLLIVLRGKHSSGAATWPSRTRTVREVLHVSRRDRWYNLRAGERSVFVDDTVHYVADAFAAKLR